MANINHIYLSLYEEDMKIMSHDKVLDESSYKSSNHSQLDNNLTFQTLYRISMNHFNRILIGISKISQYWSLSGGCQLMPSSSASLSSGKQDNVLIRCLWLVMVGGGYSIFEAVNINFQEEGNNSINIYKLLISQ